MCVHCFSLADTHTHRLVSQQVSGVPVVSGLSLAVDFKSREIKSRPCWPAVGLSDTELGMRI